MNPTIGEAVALDAALDENQIANITSTTSFEKAVQTVSEALDKNQGSISKAEIIRGLDLQPDTHAKVRSHFGLENC
jgi:exosome complex RNA-binding protein Rrp42 (RNase PH superfamily)